MNSGLLFITALSILNGPLWGIKKVPILEINLTEYELVKETPFHNVYYQNEKCEYMKIWIKDSWHFQNRLNHIFLAAVEQGFFEELAPLEGVIIEDSDCIGYITKECQPVGDGFFRILSLDDLKNSHERVIELFRLYKKNILKTGYCFYGDHLSSWNMGILENKCYFFDLDRIAILEEFKVNMHNLSWMLFVLSDEY